MVFAHKSLGVIPGTRGFSASGKAMAGNRPDFVALDRCDCRGATIGRNKLHFVGCSMLVNVDNRAYIASPKSFAGKIRSQRHTIMFVDLHLL